MRTRPKANKPKPQRRGAKSTVKRGAMERHSNADWPDLVYGKNPVYEAIKAGKRKVYEILTTNTGKDLEAQEWYKLAKQKDIKVDETDSRELSFLSEEGVHQGVVARVHRYQKSPLSDLLKDSSNSNLVLALDCIQDPHNFGAICRSAVSFGVKYVIIPQDRSAPLSGTTFKSSAGALEHLQVIEVTNLVRALKELKESEYWIYGASLSESSVGLQKVSPANKSVLVMGSEGKGIRRLVEETCDQLVKIEMVGGFESLNVAQAGSVLLYEFWKKGTE